MFELFQVVSSIAAHTVTTMNGDSPYRQRDAKLSKQCTTNGSLEERGKLIANIVRMH